VTRWCLLAAAAALAAAACGRDRAAGGAAPAPPQHVLVVTIDTLRADRLGAYGATDVATPAIDRLAREGGLAAEALVHVPLTRPSHVSIFTGLYPSQHGVRDNISPPLAATVPTLASVFKAAGFHTSAFVSSIVLSAQSGLARGFDDYSDRFEAGADDARFLDTLQRRGDITAGEAIAWLGDRAHDRTFTWVHLYDPHDPYEPPEPYASRYADRPYDGEVAWSDELVGRLDAALTRLGIRDQTLIVITSDHGEGLGEHDEPVHGFFVYQTTLRVPFIVRGPGVTAGTRLGGLFRAVDLFPTVLDLAGVTAPPSAAPRPGRSRAAALRGVTVKDAGDGAEESGFAESLTPKIHYGWSDLQAIVDGRWKYVLAPRPELYDLARDPREQSNLVETEPARARALRAALERHLADQSASAAAGSSPTTPVPADVVEKLGALGYVAVGGAPERGSAGADPKDKIGDYKLFNHLLREGLVALREQRFTESADRFGALASHGVDSFEAHYYYGRALAGLKRWRDAAQQFELAIPRLPAFAPSYLALADCRKAAGDLGGAVGALERGRAALPGDARLARRLGELHRDRGDFAAAERSLREAIAADPAEPSQWNSLGMLIGARGDLAEAERLFRAAIDRDPHEARYTYNLGLTLEREHRDADAAAMFRKTLEIDPAFAAARDRLGSEAAGSATKSRKHEEEN
jgi:arylsulfatase A-like enzyme/Flp pilus assembly protein TadD